MEKKSILLFQNTTEEQIATIQKIAPDYEILKGWEDNSQQSFDDVEILYGWNFNIGPQILNHPSSKLKWIQSHTAGIDYMDLASLKDKGISLTTSSGIHAVSIAESVFGMLLSYVRGIGNSIKNQSKKEWASPKQIMELNKSTIMIVGTGNIGVQVGRLAKAFGMETIGVNRSGNSVEYMDTVIKQTQLMDYINQADFVVNIMPLTDLTRYYFNKDVFSKMKEGSAFINVGRGQTVQVDDLMDALDHGILAFVGLDVFEKEPLPKDSPLWEREDVLITPHISGLIKHFKTRLFVIFEENLRAYMEGKELPRNKVDYNRSY